MTISAASPPASPVDLPDAALGLPEEVFVLSDLHLGEGYDRHGRYSPMEEFFHDDAFARFLAFLQARHAERPQALLLVFNGDVFDFLTVTKVPPDEASFSVSRLERRFGLKPTAAKSVYKVEQIMAGHVRFFDALARFIAAGHRVAFTRGNHDLELYFPAVQARIRAELAAKPGGPSLERLDSHLSFHQIFLLLPGLAYIEHGNQYEASNSIRYPLRPLLPPRRRSEPEEMLDYPLGSFFVRYFYNSVHRLHPFTPKLLSVEQYLDFLRRYNLFSLIRVGRRHFPYFLQALRPHAPAGSSRNTMAAEVMQEDALEALRHCTDPPDLYRKVNALKIVPLAASKMAFVKEMTKPLIKRGLWTAALVLLSLYLWLLLFNLIQAPLLIESVFTKAILLSLLTLATFFGVTGGISYLSHKIRAEQSDPTVEKCAERADALARMCQVKRVVMGHTHVVDMRSILDGEGVYLNAGTWTSTDNPWDRMHPDARRFTFVRLTADAAEILRWNDDAGRLERVPLFNQAVAHEARPFPPFPPAA